MDISRLGFPMLSSFVGGIFAWWFLKLHFHRGTLNPKPRQSQLEEKHVNVCVLFLLVYPFFLRNPEEFLNPQL